MINRYGSRGMLITPRNGIYQEICDKRGIGFAKHFSTPNLSYPEIEEIQNLDVISHTWKEGDRLWKLAAKHYGGKGHLWWIIAWFNHAPTEGHLEIGEIVYVPLPLEKILSYLRV